MVPEIQVLLVRIISINMVLLLVRYSKSRFYHLQQIQISKQLHGELEMQVQSFKEQVIGKKLKLND